MEIMFDAACTPPRLALGGELTIYAAAELKGRLLERLAQSDAVEIDLSRVSDIDTSGLQLLILAKRYAEAKHKDMQLVGHSAPVLALLELYNLAAFFGDPLVLTASERGGKS